MFEPHDPFLAVTCDDSGSLSVHIQRLDVVAELHSVADLQGGSSDDLGSGFDRAEARLYGGDHAVEMIVEEPDPYGEEERLDVEPRRAGEDASDLLGRGLGQVERGGGRSR